jgi:membrane-associated phospholipid phosphatase
VSGETSLAVWLVACALVLPARYRGPALVVAILDSAFMGASRLVTGAHFASDVLFAVMVTAWSMWLMHWLVFRDPATAPTPQGADDRRRDLGAIFGVSSRLPEEAQQPPNGGIAPRGPLSRNA